MHDHIRKAHPKGARGKGDPTKGPVQATVSKPATRTNRTPELEGAPKDPEELLQSSAEQEAQPGWGFRGWSYAIANAKLGNAREETAAHYLFNP